MRLFLVVVFLTFVASAAAFVVNAQGIQEWDHGTLDGIKGMRRVYVYGPMGTRDVGPLAELIDGRHGLRVVRNPKDSEFRAFYNYYPHVSGQRDRADPVNRAVGRMIVYHGRGHRPVIVWNKEIIAATRDAVEASLARDFLEDFAKLTNKKR